MRKLFTLSLALLASIGMWADPTLPANATPTGTLDVLAGDAKISSTRDSTSNRKIYRVYNMGDSIRTKALKNGNATWVAGPKNDGGSSKTMAWANGVTDAEKLGFTGSGSINGWGIHNSRYCGIRVTNCTEAAVTTMSNDDKNNKDLLLQVFVKSGDNWNFVETKGEGLYNKTQAYVLTTSALDATKEYVILLTSSSSSGSMALEIRFASSTLCDNPDASIIDDAVGYIDDPIDLGFTSSNTSAKDTVVTLGGAAATKGTHYTFVAEGFKPLVAGVFEITISQAKDATYCAVEESVTLTISSKTPISTAEVKGPATARIGEEVTLTLVTDYIADTIYWTLAGSVQESEHAATLTFTPDHAGSYVYAAHARNQFNAPEEWIIDDTTIVVSISNDATLSDLKVNGTTIEGFNPETLSYNMGEIGIYEALAITYTVNDAPYATAVLKNKIITDGKDTVVVTAEDGVTINEYVINYTRGAATELVSINDTTVWDWSKAGAAEIKLTDTSLPTKSQEFNFADILSAPDASFNAAAIMGIGEYAVRESKYFQGPQLKFNTTVPGTLEVIYSNTGNRSKEQSETEGQESQRRFLTVNGVQYGTGTMRADATVTTSDIPIVAGNVIISGVRPYYAEHTTEQQYLRIYKVTFKTTRYTVTYNVGTNGTCATETVKIVKDADATLPVVTPNEGYRFDGWFTAATEGTKVGKAGEKITITKDTTLYAQYSAFDFYIAGIGGWEPDQVLVNGISHTFENLAAGSYEFKITKDGTWNTEKGFSDLTPSEVIAGLYGNGSNNVCFTLTEAGNVTITYDGEVFKAEGNFEPQVVKIKGAWDTWAEHTAILSDDKKSASVTLNLPAAENVEFVVLINDDDYRKNSQTYDRNNNSATGITGDSGQNMKLTSDKAGAYKFTWTFGTNGLEITFPSETAIDNVAEEGKAVKVIRNGQLFIEKNGHLYNAMGQMIK